MPEIELHPEIAKVAGAVPIPTINEESLASVRGAPIFAPVELSGRVERSDHVVQDDSSVFVRVHRPVKGRGATPAVCLLDPRRWLRGRDLRQ